MVSCPPDIPDTVQASPTTVATPTPIRVQRHRRSTTIANPPAATVTPPGSPAGTDSDAPGTFAVQCATRSSHHNSGPVNLISKSVPAGHSHARAAAAVPTTVIGGMTSYPLAALGAVLVGLLESFASFYASAFKEVIVFSLLIPFLLWRSLVSHHVEEEQDE